MVENKNFIPTQAHLTSETYRAGNGELETHDFKVILKFTINNYDLGSSADGHLVFVITMCEVTPNFSCFYVKLNLVTCHW